MIGVKSLQQRSLNLTRLLSFSPGQAGRMEYSASASTAEQEIIYSKYGAVGVILLNRQKALNSINQSMVVSMHQKLKEWTTDGTKLVICKGSGAKAFCAGGDVVAIYNAGKPGQDNLMGEFFREEYILNHQIGTLKIPYVALIHGITMGGGVGISVHGKFRVATEKTMFAMPETAIGFLTDVGGSYFLPRLPGNLGLYLALTGDRLVGKDVKFAGVATHFVDAAQLPFLEKDLISLKNPDDASVADILSKFEKKSEVQKDVKFSMENKTDWIDNTFGGSSMEDIVKNLRDDSTEWSKQTLSTLAKMSPTSLKIVHRQIQLGKSKDLAECLKMELRVALRLLRQNDFYEGVRAKLVDKDNKPAWKPSRLEDIPDTEIDRYFAPFSDPKQELQL
ncbi:3-hydroxyisobutyryl-CoA hydrolase, mitochondrial [Hypsibius exemplaris]|uniref:3-hydroxyisobutyryl-CoA hydrolase, mitochondrial n=1 Tax=Hypsibius exemplaris TaxID=2072580 RepID=A0A1W0X4S8_HYPEX|nr:3-hydroxyisobutyryl-CoA hydrolase, mitochondrial [Hypsibius exemplaris]